MTKPRVPGDRLTRRHESSGGRASCPLCCPVPTNLRQETTNMKTKKPGPGTQRTSGQNSDWWYQAKTAGLAMSGVWAEVLLNPGSSQGRKTFRHDKPGSTR